MHHFARTALTALTAGAILLAAWPTLAQGPPQTPPPPPTSLEIPVPTPRVIVSEVFTGTLAQVVDEATLIVERDMPRGADRDEVKRRQRVRLHLYGVVLPPGDPQIRKAARDLLQTQLKHGRVRVEAIRRDRRGEMEAVVTPVPQRATPPRSAFRPLDTTGTSSDLPRGATSLPATPPALSGAEPSLNIALVRAGFARADGTLPQRTGRDREIAHDLAEAQELARKDGKGLWAKEAK